MFEKYYSSRSTGKSNFILPSYLYYGVNTLNKSNSSPSSQVDIEKILKGENCPSGKSYAKEQRRKTVVLNVKSPMKHQDLITLLKENEFDFILKNETEFNILEKQIEDEELSAKPRSEILVIDESNLNSVRLDMRLAPIKEEAKGDITAEMLDSEEFSVWKNDTVTNPDDLTAKLFSKLNANDGRNTLVTCASQSQLAGVRYKALKFLDEGTNMSCKIIDSADDLRLALCAKVNDANEIEVKSAKDGELYKFITDESSQKKVLMVDWSNFTQEEILRCKSILNESPTLDGVELKNVKIVSLQTSESRGKYLDEEFASMHQSEINIPTDISFEMGLRTELTEQKNLKDDHFEIDLAEKENPLATLKGLCTINKNKATWEEGALIEAIKSGRNIAIYNMPKAGNDAELIRRLLEDAIRTGEIDVYGRKFKVSKDIKVSFVEGERTITFEDIKSVATFKARQPTENDICVNPSNFNHLNEICSIDENGDMVVEPGIMEQNAGQTIPICISASISNSQWKKLVSMAKKYEVKLDITVEQSIELPFALDKRYMYKLLNGTDKEKGGILPINTGAVIEAKDIGFAVNNMINCGTGTVFIDASEMTNDELIGSVVNKTHFDENGCHFKFESVRGAIINSMMEGEVVCVYGDMNQDLINSLSSIISNGTININGKQTKINGRLNILTNKEIGIPCSREIVGKYGKKYAIIKKKYGIDQLRKRGVSIEKNSSNEDKKRVGDIFHHNDFNTLSAFIASDKDDISEISEDLKMKYISEISEDLKMKYIKKPVDDNALNPDFDNAEKIAAEFNEKRMKAVTKKLNKNLCVFAVGEEGSGKTSFFESKEFETKADVFKGIESLGRWAEEEDGDIQFDRMKVLLIDEDQITDSKYSIFDGLFVDQDIVVDGVSRKLDSRHRVVFVANPKNYRDAKKIPDIIQAHGGVFKFDEIPAEVLYNNIVKSIFQPFKNEQDKQFWLDTAKTIVQAYQKINAISDSEQILSPTYLNESCQSLRGLANEVIMRRKAKNERETNNTKEYFKKEEIGNALRMNIQFSVPEKHRDAVLSLIDSDFGEHKAEDLDKQTIEELASSGFYVMDSNKDLIEGIDDATRLRHLNMLSGGRDSKSCVIIECEQEFNQNAALSLIMKGKGFKEIDISLLDMKRNDQLTNEQRFKGFISMPNRATETQKEIVLQWAFENEVAVIWNGLNSVVNSPLEAKLNAYLCGKDVDGKPAKKSGFFIIATQGKEKAKGRLKLSDASMKRTMKVLINDYKDEELVKISQIAGKDVSESEAIVKVAQYRKAQAYAKANKLTSPKFADYLASIGCVVQKTKPTSLKQINAATGVGKSRISRPRLKIKDRKPVGLPAIEPRSYSHIGAESALEKAIRNSSEDLVKQKEDTMKVTNRGFKHNFFKPDPPDKKRSFNITYEGCEKGKSRLSKGRDGVGKIQFSEKVEYFEKYGDEDKVKHYNPNANPKEKENSILKSANQDVVKSLIAILGFKEVDDFIKNADKEDLRIVKLAVRDQKFEAVDLRLGRNPMLQKFCHNMLSKSAIDTNKISKQELDELMLQLIKLYDEYTYVCYKDAMKIEEKNEFVRARFNGIKECLTKKGHDNAAACDTNEIMHAIDAKNFDGVKEAIEKEPKLLNEYSVYHGRNAIILGAIKVSKNQSDDCEERKIMELLLSQKEIDLKSKYLLNGMTAFHIACVSGNDWLQAELLKKDPQCDKALDFSGKDARYYLKIPKQEADIILKNITQSRREIENTEDTLSQALFQSLERDVSFESDDLDMGEPDDIMQSKGALNEDAVDGKINKDESILKEFVSTELTKLSPKSDLNNKVKDGLLKMISDISSVNKLTKVHLGSDKYEDATMLSSLSSQFCAPDCSKQLEELMKALKNRGADVNMKLGLYGGTALHLAALHGRNNTLKLMLDMFANAINYKAKDENGNNIAHIVLMNGCTDIGGDGNVFATDKSCSAQALIEKIINASPSIINEKMRDGNTLLHIALMRRDLEMAKLLIKNGADINAVGKDGLTPEMMIESTYEDVSKYIGDNIPTFKLSADEYSNKENIDKIKKMLLNIGRNNADTIAEADVSKTEKYALEKEVHVEKLQDANIGAKMDSKTSAEPDAQTSTQMDAKNRSEVNSASESVKFTGYKGMISAYKTSGAHEEKVAILKYAEGEEAAKLYMQDEDALKSDILNSIVEAVCKAKDKFRISDERVMYLLKIAEKEGGIGNLTKDAKSALGIKPLDIMFSSEVQKNMDNLNYKNKQILSPKASGALRTKRVIQLYNLMNADGTSLEESLQNYKGKESLKVTGYSRL